MSPVYLRTTTAAPAMPCSDAASPHQGCESKRRYELVLDVSCSTRQVNGSGVRVRPAHNIVTLSYQCKLRRGIPGQVSIGDVRPSVRPGQNGVGGESRLCG